MIANGQRLSAVWELLWRRLPIFLVLVMAFVSPVLASGFAVKKDEPLTLSARLDSLGAHALVIGVSEFDDRVWTNLPGVRPEIEDVSRALAAQGFRVETPRDTGRLSRDELRQTVQRFVQNYGRDPNVRLVIYLASHGYRDTRADGYGLIIASDTPAPEDPEFLGKVYSVNDLSFDLAGLQTRNLFLFVNACFSGAMVPVAQASNRSVAATDLTETTEAWGARLLESGAKLMLTAGSDDQVVPDEDNPFARAIVSGLDGEADANGDGLILGTELAYHVREAVARETIRAGAPNDPFFALLPTASDEPAALQGDFVFLTPGGPSQTVSMEPDELLKARQNLLPASKFTECVDCPVMVELPAAEGGTSFAIAETETTFAAWDACYREFGCRRYIDDAGFGRGDRPVFGVTWQDVLEFVSWVDSKSGSRCESYRLPQTDEWRVASGSETRGTTDLSTVMCRDCARFGGQSGSHAVRSGSLPANLFGLHEMNGNLWEWVTVEGQECTVADLLAGTNCPTDGRVIGGSFATVADAMTDASEGVPMPRTSNVRPYSLPTVGFRVACELR